MCPVLDDTVMPTLWEPLVLTAASSPSHTSLLLLLPPTEVALKSAGLQGA